MAKHVRVEYRTLVVIWFALLFSQIAFLAVAYVLKPQLLDLSLAGPVLGDQPLIVLAFAVAAAAFFILGQVLSRQHMRRAVQDQDQACVQTGLVLGCALSEAASILGIILALVWEYHYFFLWVALGALGVLLNFPRKSDLAAASYKNQIQ
jgi:hypothetical protein